MRSAEFASISESSAKYASSDSPLDFASSAKREASDSWSWICTIVSSTIFDRQANRIESLGRRLFMPLAGSLDATSPYFSKALTISRLYRKHVGESLE